MIRPQPFENSPFNNPKAQRLLAEYRRLCQRMTQANLRLVVSVAKQLCGKSPVLMDMIQEGSQGLMHAVTKFDHRRKIRFSTYATPWIKQSIFAALPNAERNIRIPENFGSQVRKLQRRMQDAAEFDSGGLNLDSGRNIFRLSNDLNLPPVDVNRLICIQRDTCSLNQANPGPPPNGSTAQACLEDLIVDHRKPNPLLMAQDLERKEFVQGLMDQALNKREHAVISLRFGFADGKDRSLAEVGREMGITRERVRQVEKQAMEKLSRTCIPLEFV
jgi:RNA polymerase primary sigma factor